MCQFYFGFGHLEVGSGHRHDLFAQDRSGFVDGPGGHRAAAAALRAGPVGRDRGVALDGVDIVDVGAQRVGGQLNDGCFQAVSTRAAVHVDIDLARRLHPDGATLGGQVAGRRAGRLDVGREPHAQIATLRQRLALLLAKAFVVKDFHRLLERLARGDVVVRHAVGVEVGHLVGAQQVSPAQFDGVEVHLACGDVEKYFPRQGFVLPRSAVGGQTAGVGEDRLVVEAGLGTRYGPGKNMPMAAVVNTGYGVGYAPTSWTKSISAAGCGRLRRTPSGRCR